MAIVCHDLKLLFIMVPGTGCSVVGKVLMEQCGGTYLPEHDRVKAGKVLHGRKHNSVAQILNDGLMDRGTLESYLVLATVRNPYDRLVTYYQRLAGDWIDYSAGVQRRQIERNKDKISNQAYAEKLAAVDRWLQRQKRKQRIVQVLGFDAWLAGCMFRLTYRDTMAGGRPHGNLRSFLFPMLDGVDVVMRTEQLESGLNEVLRLRGFSKHIELPRKNVTPGKGSYVDYYSFASRQLVQKLMKGTLDEFGYSFGNSVPGYPLTWLSEHAKARHNITGSVLNI